MRIGQYEQVLKQIDRWAQEAGACARAKSDLDEKVSMHKFRKMLEEVRARLRVHYFDAEDVHKFIYAHEPTKETR
jgi:hypothetical protein